MRAAKTINRLAKLIDWKDPLAPGNGTCQKVAHATQGSARAHLRRLSRPERLNVYRCHLCRAWHVGNAGERIR